MEPRPEPHVVTHSHSRVERAVAGGDIAKLLLIGAACGVGPQSAGTDGAGVGLDQPNRDAQQRRLPAAVAPADVDCASGKSLKVDVIEHQPRPLPALDDVVELERRRQRSIDVRPLGALLLDGGQEA